MQGLSVQNQSFIVVSSESDDFKYEPNDGLIGMGFSSIAQSRSPTFFENLISTRAVAEPMFSLHLTRGLVSESEVGVLVCSTEPRLFDLDMELCLGCFNSKMTLGSSTYFPVISKVRSLVFIYNVTSYAPSRRIGPCLWTDWRSTVQYSSQTESSP